MDFWLSQARKTRPEDAFFPGRLRSPSPAPSDSLVQVQDTQQVDPPSTRICSVSRVVLHWSNIRISRFIRRVWVRWDWKYPASPNCSLIQPPRVARILLRISKSLKLPTSLQIQQAVRFLSLYADGRARLDGRPVLRRSVVLGPGLRSSQTLRS